MITGTGTSNQGALFSASGINTYTEDINLFGAEAGIGVAPNEGPDPENPGESLTPSDDAGYFTNDYSLTVTGDIGGPRTTLFAKLGGGNLILLDEPTNDLDVDTLRALEEALLNFAGCAVVISHDRWFLDRIATHMLAFEGDSRVVWFEGNYQEYEADRRRRLGAEADQPHRIKYRKLTR